MHVYHRPLDPNGNDSLALLAGRVVPGACVLDVGAGPGVLGRYLLESRRCVVDGIEANPLASVHARSCYRHWVEADLETLDVAKTPLEGAYRHIVCADILEHLRQPEALLTRLARWLAPDGTLLLSVPNVAYAGVIAELMAGEFEYRDEGLLDRTHVHFFTRASLLRLLASCGLTPVWQAEVKLPLDMSEFARCALDGLSPALRDWLLQPEDALTYQFLVEAVPVDRMASEAGAASLESAARAENSRPLAPFRFEPALRFRAQLFWRSAAQAYDEAQSVTVFGRLGGDDQTLCFALPAGLPGLAFVRIDPADRPGFIDVFGIRLCDSDGALIREWLPGELFPPTWECTNLHPLTRERDGDPEEGVVLHLESDDPFFEIPLAPEWQTRLAKGGALELRLTYPMCAGARLLAQRYVARSELDPLQQRCAELEHENAALRDALETASSRAAAAPRSRWLRWLS